MRSTNPRISSSWCALGSPEVSCWVLVPLDLGGEWHGTARVTAGVTTQGLDLVEAGRSVADVARDLEISDQSIYTWRRQDRIDRGLVPGLSSGERAELAKAKLRIAELRRCAKGPVQVWARPH